MKNYNKKGHGDSSQSESQNENFICKVGFSVTKRETRFQIGTLAIQMGFSRFN